MTKTIDASAVVSRILTEDVLSIKQARTEWENMTGKRLDRGTLARWIHNGVGGTKLEAVRMGRDLYTSMQALTRFIEARTETLTAQFPAFCPYPDDVPRSNSSRGFTKKPSI